MRVLVVHDEPLEGGYGAEAYVRRLVGGLRDAGDVVDVVAGQRRHRGAAKILDLRDPAARRLVADRARVSNAEVIHFHNISRELSATVLAATRLPKVMTLHDYRLLGAREHSVLTPQRAVEALGASSVLRAARQRLTATIGVSDAVAAAAREAGLPSVSTVPVPVAHGDGNYWTDAETVKRLDGEGQVAFRYVGDEARSDPRGNPNGSVSDIAGIFNAKRTVLGLMPHPEDAVEALHGNTDGKPMFEGLVEALS